MDEEYELPEPEELRQWDPDPPVEASDPDEFEEAVQDARAAQEKHAQKLRKDLLTIAAEWEPVAGCYFLLRDEEVVYVGRSNDLHLRVGQHYRQEKIDFDQVALVAIPDKRVRQWLEREFLDVLKPPENSRWRP